MSTVKCTCPDVSEYCDKAPLCPTHRLWCKVDDAINEVLDGTTLQDLLDWENEMRARPE